MRNWEKYLLFKVTKRVSLLIMVNLSCLPAWVSRFQGIVTRFLIILLSRTNSRDIIGEHWFGLWDMLNYGLKLSWIIRLWVTYVTQGWRFLFKTTSAPAIGVDCSSKYYGWTAFGCNVFLWCYTDADFTMSISPVFLKGKTRYEVTIKLLSTFVIQHWVWLYLFNQVIICCLIC